MPPFIPKKRTASTPPPASKLTPVKKPKLTDVLDTESRNKTKTDTRKVLDPESDGSDSSLSDVDSEEFEDVPASVAKPAASVHQPEEEDSDDDDEFEDVELEQDTPMQDMEISDTKSKGPMHLKFNVADDIIDYGSAAKASKGKGPSKREKEIRIRTHQLHVRYLLWHNSVRHRWTCDKEIQQTLVAQLPGQIKKEVEKWKRASGISEAEAAPKFQPHKGKRGKSGKPVNPRDERDWGRPSEKLDPGKADMSRGDPLISLLRTLAAYWKKRFAITAPGLRKRGYGTKLQLRREVESFKNDQHDPAKHGERIRNIKEFREVARACEGSRDVGAQLFTALLRGLGIESRLVASLQPAGYGWTKVEQMLPRKPTPVVTKPVSSDSDSEDEPPSKLKSKQKKPASSNAKKRQPSRKAKGGNDDPLDLDESEGSVDSDDESVVDITPPLPKQRAAKYDRDLLFPIYWTEAISPITNQIIPVDPLVLEKPVASTPELLSNFEPRGAKAENARLVLAYVVGYSDDGTAKDVTVRYLRKHIWPGKTKSFRYPIEKVPVYDRTGRIKRYEDSDWFQYIMSGYVRTDDMRTAVDDIEESTDLVPQLPEKKDTDSSVDTLQSLKASADYVLERFLRREEALLPGAKAVRSFISGKGDNLKSEPVYRRADVARCLTAESWHKEGRHPKPDEQPLKMVPVRAVTLTRKREAEEHERLTGEKQLQGLYSWDQTEFIIPPPIKNGVIPKNSYGNMDCFAPGMVPKGAVHIALKGTVRICKKLEIDYAEAVVGFEFGNKRAVPVISGVVVAKENENMLRKAWKQWNDEQKKKEAVKQEKLVLDLWRKFIMGLRIRERVGEMYGEDLDEDSAMPTHLKKGVTIDEPIDVDEAEGSGAGGFMPANDALDDDEIMGGGFLFSDEDDQSEPEDLIIEDEHPKLAPTYTHLQKGKGREQDSNQSVAAAEYPTPTSMAAPQKANRALTPKMKTKSQGIQKKEAGIDDTTESDSDLSDLQASEEDQPSMNATRKASRAQVDGADSASASDAPESSPTASSSESNSSDSDSSADNDDKDEEQDYLPTSASRRRRQPASSKPTTPAKQSVQPPRSARSTRSNNIKTPQSTPAQSAPKSNIQVIIGKQEQSTPNCTSKNAQGNETGKTSPYFDSSSKVRRKSRRDDGD